MHGGPLKFFHWRNNKRATQPRIIITDGKISSMFLSSTFRNQRRKSPAAMALVPSLCESGAPTGPRNLSCCNFCSFLCLSNCSRLSPPQCLDDFCIIAPSHFSFRSWPTGSSCWSWTEVGGRVPSGQEGKKTHALLPWIPGPSERVDCGQSENAARGAQSAEDYISQKPRGLRVVYLFSVRWTTPSWGCLEGCGFEGPSQRGTRTPPRPWSVEERPPWQGGTPAVAPAPAGRGALSSCPAAECRSQRMRRGFCRSSRDGPERATSYCRAARPPWPS